MDLLVTQESREPQVAPDLKELWERLDQLDLRYVNTLILRSYYHYKVHNGN